MKNTIDWNCCEDGNEPDWSRFDAIETGPCAVDPEGVTHRIDSLKELNEGDSLIYTVYGHLKEGGVEALHDFSNVHDYVVWSMDFETELPIHEY